jgi:hypothetical protein
MTAALRLAKDAEEDPEAILRPRIPLSHQARMPGPTIAEFAR